MRQSGARRVPRAGFARRLAAFVLTLAAAGSTVAAAAAEGAADRGSAPDSPDAKTCLVLSGGGARGLAHVGVLERIEALRIPIRCIVGTSMGAVVGALYASGMNAQAIASLLTHADWAGLSKDSVEREDLGSNRKRDDYAYPLGLDIGVRDGQLRLSSGLLNGQRFELMLRRWLGADDRSIDFDHLPIPFRAVAADIETGRAVVMSRGRLVDAVRASMAVPGLFSPVERDGATLIDGGVAENLPVDVALAMGAQHVIAVDVSTPPARRDELRNPVQVFQQMVSFLTSQNVKTQIALLRPQDLLITPDLKGLDFQAFESAPEFIARGLAAADRADDALRPLGTDATRYAAYRRRLARPATAAPIVLAAIEVEPQPHVPDSAIRAIAGLEPGVALDAPAIEASIERLLASGDFERVVYELHPAEPGPWLGIAAKERSGGPNFLRFGASMSLAADGNGSVGISLGHLRTWADAYGAQWRNDLLLGRSVGYSSAWFQPLGVESAWFVSAHYAYLQQPRDFTDPALASTPFWRANFTTQTLGLDIGWRIPRWGDVRLGATARDTRVRTALGGYPIYDSGTQVSGFLPIDIAGRERGATASLYLDRLDAAFLPRRGLRLNAEAFVGRTAERLGSDASTDTLRRLNLDFTAAWTAGQLTFSPRLRYAEAAGLRGNSIADVTLGGFQALSGTPQDSLSGNNLRFARLDMYYSLGQVDLFGRRMFAGGTLEAGTLASGGGVDYGTRELRRAFSTYVAMQTALGPLYAAVGKTLGGGTALYLFLGRP